MDSLPQSEADDTLTRGGDGAGASGRREASGSCPGQSLPRHDTAGIVAVSSPASNATDEALIDADRRVQAIEAKLGLQFKDRRLLLQALLHRSAVLEAQRDGRVVPSVPSNERLEFLGDAVLSMLVAHYAYTAFPEYGEGMLTEVRAALVRRSTLGILAEDLGIADLVYMGRAEQRVGGRGRATVLAEALEAIVAAVYLDHGLDAASRVVDGLLHRRVPDLLERAETLNAKSRLQELAQAKLHQIPVYRFLRRSGPDHDSRFTVEVLVGDFSEVGVGTSKQGAEQVAAKALLAALSSAEDLVPVPSED
jgi:ribonuclease-3